MDFSQREDRRIFSRQKNQILSRKDNSSKGSIDAGIRDVVDMINSYPDYFTSSSCSGRIFLMEIAESGRKDESEWVFVKHGEVSFDEIKKGMEGISDKNIWLKQEGMIIHVCCRDLDAACRMLDICHESGLKRAGIVTLGRKIMIEAFNTDRIETPVAEKGRIIVSDDYLRLLLVKANKKYEKNVEKIKKFSEKISLLLKKQD